MMYIYTLRRIIEKRYADTSHELHFVLAHTEQEAFIVAGIEKNDQHHFEVTRRDADKPMLIHLDIY